jgi:hemolysin III
VTGVAVLLGTALRAGGSLRTISLGVYGLALLAMLTCSAAYNLTRPSPAKEVLRRLDHAAIFAMIAGTYTPLTLLVLQGTAGAVLFGFVWIVAAVGMVLKILYPRRFERTGLVLYLLLGWCGVVTVGSLVAVLPTPALLLLGAGCLFYSIGVVFHLRERLPYANAIWHAFVLGAAACHYALMLIYLTLPAEAGSLGG